MATGRVLKFDPEKGYGFIRPDDGSQDLFLHVTELRHIEPKQLSRNTRVTFSCADSPRGPKAVDVRRDSGDGDIWSVPGTLSIAQPQMPAAPTEEAWRDLLDAGFRAMMAHARANGWVQ